MANDTYTIIYYDSNDTAHTTALADLITAGGVDVGDGIVDSASAYFGTGIYDSTTQYATGTYDGTTYNAYGIIYDNGGTPAYAFFGISDGSSYYATGVAAPSTYYSYGILYDNAGTPTHSSAGIRSDDGVFHGNGILYYDGFSYVHAQDGIYDGTTQYATGIYNGVSHFPAGILTEAGVHNYTGISYYDGFAYVRAATGILDIAASYTATGVFDGVNTTSLFGILYDNAGTPTYTDEGIYSAVSGGYYASGVYGYFPEFSGYGANPSGVAADGNCAQAGITDGLDLYTTGILYDNVGTPTYESIGTYDGTDFHYDGIMFAGMYHDYGIVSYNGGAANYNDYGILDNTDYYNSYGILGGNGTYYGSFNSAVISEFDGSSNLVGYYYSGVLYDVAGTPTYAADGCWNTTTDTYYPIQALDVLGGGLA